MTIDQAHELALQHHQAGRLAEAEALYRQILAVQPQHADALHLLGVIAHQVGRNDVAVDLIQQAIALTPTAPAFHSNLGEVLRCMGQCERAIASHRMALGIAPDFADALNGLGSALQDAGRREEALDAFRAALRSKPDSVDAHNNMGNALRDSGRPEDAAAAYRAALQFKPDHPEAHSNLGNALLDLGRMEEAVAEYQTALRLKPDFPVALSNLGTALRDLGRLAEAAAACRTALALRPGDAIAHCNLGSVLRDMGLSDQAVAEYRTALRLKPDFIEARGNLLFCLHYLPDLDPEEIFCEHGRWEELHAQPLAGLFAKHTNAPNPERRLRIGFISPDFREHSVAYFLENLLAAHDGAQVEIYCYADLLREDGFSERLRQHAGQWRRIAGMADSQVADLIVQDGIDILVDLAGHTAHNRLLVFARKPAPVQVTWLGYCDTTGLSAMDYRFTDGYADPPGTTEHLHSEELVRLPDIFACFRPAADSPDVLALPALARGHVTFASFHTLAKINEPLLERWARILIEVPGSRLLMAASGLDEDLQQRRLRDVFAGKGIDGERLEFKGQQSMRDYLALHNAVDVLLDCDPFTGHTISCHALWMGVPVVTLAGKTHCGRMVGSVLSTLGLPDLIGGNADQYVEIAVKLAGDLPRLAHLLATLRERMRNSALTDAPRFARNVEAAFRQMWRAWCAKQCSNPMS